MQLPRVPSVVPRKPPGWCEIQGAEHAWKPGPVIARDPPTPTRICLNCGRREYLHQEWRDKP